MVKTAVFDLLEGTWPTLIIFLVIVIILIVAVLSLILYNISIHKKIQTYKNINQKINQDFC